MNAANQNKPRLIAIALSHYCEKVSWALDYLDIDEELCSTIAGKLVLRMYREHRC